MQIFFLLVLWSSLNARADVRIRAQIHDVDLGKGKERPLIFLSTGQVVSLDHTENKSLQILREGMLKKTWFQLTVNDKRQVVGVEPHSTPLLMKLFSSKQVPEDVTFEPSILKDLEAARSFFYSARTDHKGESQCYNRAHVWAYEWRIKRNLYSNKVWLFFTRKFIRKYKFDWWFHVAPMVHVVIAGKVRQRVMDVKYARGPLKLKQWTDLFLRDDADCPVVEKYSDHADYPESGSCFVMKSSMYYYQPVDLEMEETLGQKRSMWSETDVLQAFDEAFGGRNGG